MRLNDEENEGELSYYSRKVKTLEKSLKRKPTWQEMLGEIDKYEEENGRDEEEGMV
jgi:hypothetical protein